MSEIEELADKIHNLMDHVRTLTRTNELLKQEFEKKCLENEALKRELEHVIERYESMIAATSQVSLVREDREYGMPAMRIIPVGGGGAHDTSSPRHGGGGGSSGKKTSL